MFAEISNNERKLSVNKNVSIPHSFNKMQIKIGKHINTPCHEISTLVLVILYIMLMLLQGKHFDWDNSCAEFVLRKQNKIVCIFTIRQQWDDMGD